MSVKKERQPWHLFSCLLGMGQVTQATPIPLPKKGKKIKDSEEGEDDGKQGARAEESWDVVQTNGEKCF